MRLDLAFVDLDHRPQRLRLASCFGWLHHPSVLRGLTPPACTNLHSSNSIQMCERNPTLSEKRGAQSCPSSIVFSLYGFFSRWQLALVLGISFLARLLS